jgi:hypothetical protein
MLQFEGSDSGFVHLGSESCILFSSILIYQEDECSRTLDPARQESLYQPSRQPWFSLLHCLKRRTRPTRGDQDPSGIASSAVPVLRRADDHRSRTTAQTSARPTTPADPDPPRSVSPLPEDVYGTARLVTAVRTIQLPLPTTRVGTAAPSGWQLGAIYSRHRRRVAFARPINRATVG